MEPWEAREHIEKALSKDGMYDRYRDLCMKVETPPRSYEKFVDTYVDVIVRRKELYDEAVKALPVDKRLLLESLEKDNAPLEELVTVDILPPFVTVQLNDFSDGVICLYVLFPNGPDRPIVQPAHVGYGASEATFL